MHPKDRKFLLFDQSNGLFTVIARKKVPTDEPDSCCSAFQLVLCRMPTQWPGIVGPLERTSRFISVLSIQYMWTALFGRQDDPRVNTKPNGLQHHSGPYRGGMGSKPQKGAERGLAQGTRSGYGNDGHGRGRTGRLCVGKSLTDGGGRSRRRGGSTGLLVLETTLMHAFIADSRPSNEWKSTFTRARTPKPRPPSMHLPPEVDGEGDCWGPRRRSVVVVRTAGRWEKGRVCTHWVARFVLFPVSLRQVTFRVISRLIPGLLNISFFPFPCNFSAHLEPVFRSWLRTFTLNIKHCLPTPCKMDIS